MRISRLSAVVLFTVLLVASACSSSAGVESLEASAPSETTDTQAVNSESAGDERPPAETGNGSSDGSADVAADPEPETDSTEDDVAPTDADTGSVQTYRTESRDGYDVVTITVPEGDDVSFALLPPTEYDSTICEAIRTWEERWRDHARDLEPGTSLEPLVDASERLLSLSAGDFAIYLRERTENLGRQQALVNAAGVGDDDLAGEDLDALRALRDELDIFRIESIAYRFAEDCPGVFGHPVGPDPFEDVIFEAPDTLLLVEGQTVLFDDVLQFSEIRAEASWVSPKHQLLGEPYDVTQDPWLYLDFVATNPTDAIYDWGRGAFPFDVRSSNGSQITDTERRGQFEPLEPGEVRSISVVFPLRFGFLQPDGLRALPTDLAEYGLNFGRSVPEISLGPEGQRPAAESAESDSDTTDPDAETNEQASSDLDPGVQAEIDETVGIFVAIFALDADQEECLRQVFAAAGAEFILSTEGSAADLYEVIEPCEVEVPMLRASLSASYDEVVADCLIDALGPEQAKEVFVDTFTFEADAQVAVIYDELRASTGC